MPVKGAQSPWKNEPSKTTPLNEGRLNYTEERLTEAINYAKGKATNLEEYAGAVNDGATDSTKAVQEALTAAGNGGILLVPPGLGFVVKEPLTIPASTTILGENRRTCGFIANGEFDLFRMKNTDSAVLNSVIFQNGKEGIRVGNGDTSVKRTTNLMCSNVTVDTMAESGWKLASVLTGDLTACHAQGCSPGLYIGEAVTGLTVNGGKYYHNQGHGITFGGAASYGPVTVIGAMITDNSEGGTTFDGVNIEAGAEGITLLGNTIGNYLLGGGKQRNGVHLPKTKAKAIIVAYNRISKNVTNQILNEQEGTVKEQEERGVLVEKNVVAF